MNDFEKRWKLYDKNSFDEDVELLGQIAMRWRSGEATDACIEDYEKAVVRLINSGKWFEMPPPEDLLPDHMMPDQFYEYWNVSPRQESLVSFTYDVLWVMLAVLFIVFVGWLMVTFL